jgi:hypothetical protein
LRNAAAVLLIAATSGIAGYFFSRVKLAPETYTEIVVPRGERSKVILSDGTTVKLNGDSRLRSRQHSTAKPARLNWKAKPILMWHTTKKCHLLLRRRFSGRSSWNTV